MKVFALISAAGSGTRMGSDTPKQFLPVKGKPLLSYTVNAFNSHPLVDEIIIVTNKDWVESVKDLCKQFNKVKHVVEGGSTRQESVYLGLSHLKGHNIDDQDIVLIHDGARPLVSESIITSNIKECEKYDAVETVINATDTITQSVSGDILTSTPNRKELYQVQTPQTFRFGLIYKAHKDNKASDATDDAQLVHNLQHDVHLVMGDKKNFKVTTADDLEYLEYLLEK